MSSMAFGGSLAGISRVAFEATGVGETTRDIERVGAAYRRGNQEMSDSAIKVALAQRRLESALKAGPAAVDRQARAELNLRRAEAELRGETDRLTASATHNERALGRLGRGAIAGSGLFRGLGRSVAFASSSFLGGVGFVYALRQTLGAAKQSEVIYGRLGQAVRNVGLSWDENRAEVEKALLAQSKLSAFDDEELAQSLAQLVVRTKDVNRALELNALVADVARGRNMSLDSAMKLVLKASIGNSGALRRLGIDIDKNATSTQILAALQAKFAGQAKRYAESAQGAQDRWNVSLQNSEEIIGRALTPSIARLFREGANYLDQLNESGELQRKVNHLVDEGSQVVQGFADGLRFVRAGLSPVVRLLGGTEKAARDLVIVLAAAKLARIAMAVRGLGLAFRFVGTEAMIAGTKAVAAENSIGTTAAANTSKVRGLGGALGGLAFAAISAGLIVGDQASAGPTQGQRDVKKYPLLWGVVQARLNGAPINDLELEALRIATKGGYPITASGRTNAPANQLEAAERLLRISSGTGRGPHRTSAPTTTRTGGTGARRTPRRSVADIELDIARAQTTSGTADDLRYLRELAARYRAQAAALERRKHLSAAQKATLTSLYGQIASTESQISSIIAEGERKIDAERKKRREAAKKRAAERERQAREAEAIRLRAQKAIEAIQHRYGPHITALGDRGSSRTEAEIAKRQRGGSTSSGGVNQEDVRREIHDILAGLRGVISDFGSNFVADGPAAKQTATHAHVQTELLREQNRKLDRLVASMWHPGTRYAEAELSVAGLGVGF